LNRIFVGVRFAHSNLYGLIRETLAKLPTHEMKQQKGDGKITSPSLHIRFMRPSPTPASIRAIPSPCGVIHHACQ
jgi:hypothetical protein